MLNLTKGQVSENIIVTLTEKATLDEPYYLFIFVHTLTKQEVTKIFAPADDESDYPDRYNKFTIDTSVLFPAATSPVGEWLYEAYEQESAVNVDPTLATSLVESGKLILYPATADVYEMEEYNEQQTFKSYQG